MTYILPICVKETALFGAALEWLSYECFRLVRSAYIETTMKYKAARDERMAEMVQLCLDCSRVDVGSIYCYDHCSYDALYLGVINQNSFVFSSFVQRQEKVMKKRLEKIAAAIGELGG